jgi:DNA-binding IclR family transcriptional regulator
MSELQATSVLSRAVRIIEAFDIETKTLTVSQIARRTQLPVPTTYRLVDQLLDIGLLERAGRQIRIGVRMWELASRSQRVLSLREAARPYLEDVQAVVKHHTQLGVLEGMDVLFVEQLSSKNAMVKITRVASRLPITTCSSGLVLLANSPAEFQEKVLASELPRFTAETVVDPRRLRKMLSEVRQQGFAIYRSAVDLQAAGVAVPLRDNHGSVVAALSVIVPNDQHSTSIAVPVLLAASKAVSRAWASPVPGSRSTKSRLPVFSPTRRREHPSKWPQ